MDIARPPFLEREARESRNRDRSLVIARHGMVCASQPLAVLAGLDILKAGGNCVDAAIACNAMLGVVEPASCGIGGDLFAILWHERDRRLYGLNASGRSPRRWTLGAAIERGLDQIPRVSALSWTVPGCVDGWRMLGERFGRLPLARLLEPAIACAEEGFPLSPLISRDFDFVAGALPHLAPVYQPAGRVLRCGETFRNPLLAQSYRAIARDGATAFYEGEIAARIVAKSRELGGSFAPEDLSTHRGEWVEPVTSSYRGFDVWQLPPSGQGIAVLQLLNLLEQFDVAAAGHNSVTHLHLFIEAKKLVYEDRARFYADPAFARVPMAQLISKDYARARAALIDSRRAAHTVRPGDPCLDSDTVYLCVADEEGNMISLIQSIYAAFGSGICPDEVGFAMQNRGQAFALDPAHANRLEPGKRPFHTIIPGFVTHDGAPAMAFGVMGGDFQPQGQAQALMNVLDFGMSPQQAADVPRVRHDGSANPWGGAQREGGELRPEPGIAAATLAALADRGHRIAANRAMHGGYQAIWRVEAPRRYCGGSDPRKDGMAIGY